MRKRLILAWCVIVALIAYPVALLMMRQFPGAFGATTQFDFRASLSFGVALLVGLVVLPQRLSPLAVKGPIAAVAAAMAWVLAGQSIWLVCHYLYGTPGSENARLLISIAIAQAILGLAGIIVVLAVKAVFAISAEASAARLAAANAVVHGTASGKRTAWIISYTGVSNEPRVRRQAEALIHDGWRVVVCGFDGHSPRPEQWTYIRLPARDAFAPEMRRLLWLLRRVGAVIAVYGRPQIVARSGALLSHSCVAHWRYIKKLLLRVARQNPELKPDLVIANDYFTCDVGYALCRLSGAKFVVDCHEYAVEQATHDPRWVKWHRPCVRAVEGHYLPRADLVTTVCDGIAELLNADHQLRRPVLVIRSVPIAQPQPFRPTGERIKILYHGAIWHVRQIHTAIESMSLWRPEFDLVLRGDGDPAYLAELRRMVTRHGLDHRVFFEPAVPFERIVPEANKADIGYFSYANFSRQIEFALPNKFFEYVMAGLALCVIDLTEIGRLTRRYGFGKLIPQHSPEAIAATINSFTREEIDRCKMAAIAAAKELNWNHERAGLLAAYNDLFGVSVIGRRPAREAGSSAAIETAD